MNLIKNSAVDFQMQLTIDDAIALQKYFAEAVFDHAKGWPGSSHALTCTFSADNKDFIGQVTVSLV